MSTVDELTSLIIAKAETIRKLKEEKATKVNNILTNDI